MIRSGFVINFAETAGQGIWIQGWMLLLVNNIYREKKNLQIYGAKSQTESKLTALLFCTP
jgi:hypothetical protein